MPAFYLAQPCNDKSLYISKKKVKLLGKKPDRQEDVEKIILFWPQCTLDQIWIWIWIQIQRWKQLIFPHSFLCHGKPVWLAHNVCERQLLLDQGNSSRLSSVKSSDLGCPKLKVPRF